VGRESSALAPISLIPWEEIFSSSSSTLGERERREEEKD
jgi:hypothetical protein